MAKERIKELSLDMLDEAKFCPIKDLGVDAALGGGFPLNSIIEVFGDNSSGKTTLCFEAAFRFLEEYPDRFVYYFNYERSIDKFYVRNLLKNREDLMPRFKIVEPDYLEDGMEYLIEIVQNRMASLCIVDSLAAMEPKAEDEKALDKLQVGGFKAKLMGEVCRKLGKALSRDEKGNLPDTSVVFINHVSPVLGSFLPQKETPGGKAVKFWASLRIELGIVSRLQRDEVVIGTDKKEKITYANCVKLKVEKNKWFPPYKRAQIVIVLGKGLDRALSIIDYGVAFGVIGVKGKTDYFLVGKEEQTVRGKQKFADKINSSKPLYDFLYNKISSIIEARREEQKNPNINALSKDPSAALQADDEETPSNEIYDEFKSLEMEDDGSQDPFDPESL